MTLRVRVHVDDDGNAVVPVDKALSGQDVDLSVEVITLRPFAEAADARSETDQQASDVELFQFLSSLKKARPPKPVPRSFTPEQRDERLARFDAMTGAWEGEFPEPSDPPAEPDRHA